MIGAVGQPVATAERPAKPTSVRVRSNRTTPAGRDPAPLTPQAERAWMLAAIDRWVEAGAATLRRRDDSSLELRFGSGETWRLGENGITRES
jgi:hypothetical protein